MSTVRQDLSFGIKLFAAVYNSDCFLSIVIGIVENGESAVGSVTGTKTESAEGPGLANAAVVPVPGSERGRDRLEEEETRSPLLVGVVNERGSVGGQREETAGVGRGVENVREGAGAVTARETGRGARGWMERRLARAMESPKVLSGCWRNMKEKWVRAWRSVETGTEKGTEIAGAATGTKTGAGETGTETESTRGSGGRGIGGTAERIATAPYEMTLAPKMTWAMRMREEPHQTWRNTVKMG